MDVFAQGRGGGRILLLFAFLLASVGPGAAGQPSEQTRTLAARISTLNTDLESAVKAADSAAVERILAGREPLLQELMAADPNSALTVAVPSETAERLSVLAPRAAVETRGKWNGILRAVVADDFKGHRSWTNWYLHVGEERFQVYLPAKAPHRSGSTVSVQGMKSGGRIAASSVTVEANTTQAQCTTIGPQNIAVIMVTTPSKPSFPDGVTADSVYKSFFASAAGDLSLNNYWQETSYGLTSAVGKVFGPFPVTVDPACQYSASEGTASINDDFTAAALAAAGAAADLTVFSRLVIVFPDNSCAFSGMSQIGCTSPPSLSWLPADQPWNGLALYPSVVAHELGHALGLGHASSDDYGGVPLGPTGVPGSLTEYGDPFSVMGGGNDASAFSQYSAEHKGLILNWLPVGSYQEVRSSGSFDLRPFESPNGLRALRILRDPVSGSWLWLEYRQPIGVMESTLLEDVNGSPWTLFNGALIHYEDPSLDLRHTYLLALGQSSTYLTDSGVKRDFDYSALLPGLAWIDPYSLLSLTVNAADATHLSVSVRYDQPCASMQASPSVFDASSGSGTITVQADAGCAWTATSVTSWITLAGGTSGQGNGTINFNVAANNDGDKDPRTGTIVLGRQTLPITQAGTSGLAIGGLTTAPAGSASAGEVLHQISFQVNDSQGAGDISQVTLYAYSSDSSTHVEVDVYPSGNSSGNYLSLYCKSPGSSGDVFPTDLDQQNSGSITNGPCTLFAKGSYLTKNGNILTITLNLALAADVTASKLLFTAVAFSSASKSNYLYTKMGVIFGKASAVGSMPQLASGGGWNTTLSLLNLSSATAQAQLNFYGNDGSSLSLPMTLPQSSSASDRTGTTFSQTVNAGSLLLLNTTGTIGSASQTGWAQLSSDGAIGGYAIFKDTLSGQEAVVNLESRNASSYLLPFDNTSGTATGVAVANVAISAANIPVSIRDDSGRVIASTTLPLNASGHNSFMLADQYAVTAGKRGTVEFDTPTNGQISVLGLRAKSSGSVTTIPVLANVFHGSGSLAHVATAGGWQTAFTLVNTGATSAQATLRFFDDNGSPVPLPLLFPQTGTTQTTATVTQTLTAGASLIIQTQGPSAATAVTGSAQLTASGQVSGFAVFRYEPTAQEAVVPLESRNPGAFLLAFDNTNGVSTGLAIANLRAQTTTVPVTVRDDAGATLASGTINLSANGHASFMLTDAKEGYPITAAKRGSIEFDTPSDGQISILGIRATSGGAITTAPALAKE